MAEKEKKKINSNKIRIIISIFAICALFAVCIITIVDFNKNYFTFKVNGNEVQNIYETKEQLGTFQEYLDYFSNEEGLSYAIYFTEEDVSSFGDINGEKSFPDYKWKITKNKKELDSLTQIDPISEGDVVVAELVKAPTEE
jgi:uncharacterized protein YpmS